MKLLTNSAMKDFRACNRLYHYKYELGYRAVSDSHSLRFGTLIHLALEAWWTESGTERLEAAYSALDAQPDVDPYDFVRARELIHGYHYRWFDSDLIAIAVEKEFNIPLPDPSTGAPSEFFRLGGKIDAIARNKAGQTCIVEHKTSSEQIGPGSEYWRRLLLDGQVSMYFRGAKALGFDVSSCLYDVIGKPALRVLQPNTKRTERETPEEYADRLRVAIGESPERYYQRGYITRLREDEEDFAFDVWQVSQQVADSQKFGRHPRNYDSCSRYGRLCEFFPVCTRTGSLDDSMRYKYVGDNVNVELGGFNDQENSLETSTPDRDLRSAECR
jgi:PD-(D/E)XK nuclease superfamily